MDCTREVLLWAFFFFSLAAWFWLLLESPRPGDPLDCPHTSIFMGSLCTNPPLYSISKLLPNREAENIQKPLLCASLSISANLGSWNTACLQCQISTWWWKTFWGKSLGYGSEILAWPSSLLRFIDYSSGEGNVVAMLKTLKKLLAAWILQPIYSWVEPWVSSKEKKKKWLIEWAYWAVQVT